MYAAASLLQTLGVCICQAGKYSPSAYVCADCPRGHYCSGGVYDTSNPPAAVQCPANMTTRGLRSKSLVACGKSMGVWFRWREEVGGSKQMWWQQQRPRKGVGALSGGGWVEAGITYCELIDQQLGSPGQGSPQPHSVTCQVVGGWLGGEGQPLPYSTGTVGKVGVTLFATELRWLEVRLISLLGLICHTSSVESRRPVVDCDCSHHLRPWRPNCNVQHRSSMIS